jgi:hypothetical protein
MPWEETMKNVQQLRTELARAHGWTILGATVFAVYIFPIVERFLGNQPHVEGYIWLVVFLSHFAVGVVSLYGTYIFHRISVFVNLGDIEDDFESLKQELNTTIEQRDAHEKAGRQQTEDLKEKNRRLIAQGASVNASLASLRNLLTKQEKRDLSEDIEDLLAPLVTHRSLALGYDNNALYNLAFYLWDPQKEKLVVYWRECHPNLPRNDREWGRGEGHIGMALVQNRPLITPSLKNKEAQDLVITTKRDIPYYQSFISISVQHPDPAQSHMGALSISSNEDGQFTQEKYETLAEAYDEILSTYFLSRAGIQEMVTSALKTTRGAGLDTISP